MTKYLSRPTITTQSLSLIFHSLPLWLQYCVGWSWSHKYCQHNNFSEGSICYDIVMIITYVYLRFESLSLDNNSIREEKFSKITHIV